MDGSHGSLVGRLPIDLQATSTFNPPPIGALHGYAENGARMRSHSRIVGGASKRAFDMVVAAGALIVLSPALLGIWALVRIDSSGPGLFRQRRGGFQGRPFYIYKFRTMRVAEGRGISQATKQDDRTTKLGRFLRRYSIDELPQLLNVLLGDMTIVGPRPHALAHDREFSSVDRRYIGRHRARPGITGLAQVSGSRGPTETREKILERMNFDLTYVMNWSWAMDLKVIVRTALVVLRDRSAF